MRGLGRRDLPRGSHYRAQKATRSTAEDQAQCQQWPLWPPNHPGKRSCIRSSFSSWLLSTSRTSSRRRMTPGAAVRRAARAARAGHQHPGQECGSACPARRPDPSGAQQPSQPPPSRPPVKRDQVGSAARLPSRFGNATAGWPRPSQVRRRYHDDPILGPDPGGLPSAGLFSAPPQPGVGGSRSSRGPAVRHCPGLQAGVGSQGHQRPHRPPGPRCRVAGLLRAQYNAGAGAGRRLR